MSDKVFTPAAVGPQPDHSADEPAALTGEQVARLAYLRGLSGPGGRELTPDEKGELDRLATAEHAPHEPLAPPLPVVSNEGVLAMHGILDEALGVMHQLAMQTPTGSALVARLDALRVRYAAVFDPPKK